MKYPMISRSATLRIAEARIVARTGADHPWMEDLGSDLADVTKWWGEGADLDITPLEDAHCQIRPLVDRPDAGALDRDQIEGKAACVLYRALGDTGTNPAALDDPGFWRYVCLAHLWNFAAWRESRAFAGWRSAESSAEAPTRFKPYVDGHMPHECVPVRMFLRVKALGGLQHESLAWAVRGGTDFWRSHILRVKVGEYPSIVRAMVRRQADEETRLRTDDVRQFAKDLNRTLTNLVPLLLDDAGAADLVGELWERQLVRVRAEADRLRSRPGAAHGGEPGRDGD